MRNLFKKAAAFRLFQWVWILGLAFLGGCYNQNADLAPTLQSTTQNPAPPTFSSPTVFLNAGGNFGLSTVFQIWWVNDLEPFDVMLNPSFTDTQFGVNGIGGMYYNVQSYGHGGWAGAAFVNPNFNKVPNYTDYSSGNFKQCTLLARAYPTCRVAFNAMAPAAYQDVGNGDAGAQKQDFVLTNPNSNLLPVGNGGAPITLINGWRPVTLTLNANLTQVYMDFYIAFGDTAPPYQLWVYDIVFK